MLKLEELEVYRLAMETGEEVWTVDDWKPFAKRTIGEQLVGAADSIAANIAEGYGRFHYKKRTNSFAITAAVHLRKQRPF